MGQKNSVFAAKIDDSPVAAIGKTRMVYVKKMTIGLEANIAVKLEYYNPTCSVKDRPARKIIEDAEKRGDIVPGTSVIIEGTSGNMGIAIASIARMKGYKCIIVMPASVSTERRAAILGYGAKLVLTDPAKGFSSVLNRVNDLARSIPHSYKTSQFDNPSNTLAHYETTGPEIWEQSHKKVDIVVFGVGTGGTLSGVGRFLKEKNPNIKVVSVEPAEAVGTNKIQGIGASTDPGNLDRRVIDEVILVRSDDAINMVRRLAREEGIMGGISSGANLHAALELAGRDENKGKLIVTAITDCGERDLSLAYCDSIRSEANQMDFTTLAESLRACEQYLTIDQAV